MTASTNLDFVEDDPYRKMMLEEIRCDSSKLKAAFMDQMGSRLSEMIDHVVESFEKSPQLPTNRRPSLLSKGYTIDLKDKKKPDRLGKLPEKEFQCRPSVLTQLLELPHFRTIHHIFIASLILMLLHTIVVDLTETGMVDLGLERLLGVLGEPQRTWTLIFSLHFASIFVLYPCFYYWATTRLHYTKRNQKIFDKLATILFTTFLIAFICVPARMLWKNPLPWASSMITTMEQGRILMKMYAFVRSNVPRALNFSGRNINETANKIAQQVQSQVATVLQQQAEHDQNLNLKKKKNESGEELSENVVESEFEIMGDEAAGAGDDEGGLKVRTEDSSSPDDGLTRRKSKSVKVEVTLKDGLCKNDQDNSVNSPVNMRPQLARKESWICWDDRNFPCPDFTKYLYFLFCPTLIYRDSYPTTKNIRWNYVCWNLGQCIGCALYANFVMSRFCASHLADFGSPGHSMNLKQLLASTFSFMIPGCLMLILAFFMILHSWQNAFAEMMYFGDRLFYKDWWNCSSFSVYYKTWNILVHDWLYTYIFKDAWENGLGRVFKPLPTILVFLVSAVFHEYILCMSFNFFFPVNLILFGGFGFIFVFIGNKKQNSAVGNVLMWMALISGTGIIVAAYSMEAFARMNCAPSENTSVYWDFFVPRTISCGAIKFQWS